MTLSANTKLAVAIKGKTSTYLEGAAYSISSENIAGSFDILPYHANFVTLIKNYITVDRGLPSEKTFKIEKGLLSVYSNDVKVYVGL